MFTRLLEGVFLTETRFWILDADDTLWESAGFFQAAEDSFVELMEGLGADPGLLRREIHRRDMERLSLTGYGAEPYLDTLRTIMDELAPDAPDKARQSFESLCGSLLNHPVTPYEGVVSTLSGLSAMGHRLFLYTLGRRGHQLEKLARSGLASHFEACVVVDRKTPENLERIMAEFGLARENVCVVGNSPRSDIAPAIEIGVNAVQVEHNGTWAAERMDLPESGLVARVSRISDILSLVRSEGERVGDGL
jgi:putative hydrolase of the HAD superfamily